MQVALQYSEIVGIYGAPRLLDCVHLKMLGMKPPVCPVWA